jgi:dihydrodipicolinate synthase/N-acetylneuraminate lyase
MLIFIDIDETICSTPESRDYSLAQPIKKNIGIANKLYDEGNTIVYWTARGSVTGIDWTAVTQAQLNDWGVRHHELRLGKPPYDLMICDKTISSLNMKGNLERVMNTHSSVTPIPPDFDKNENLFLESTNTYVDFLIAEGVQTVMTTAGTSQFGLMSLDEIHSFNAVVAKSSASKKIIGMPPLSQVQAKEFARFAQKKYLNESCFLMALYPDRWYDNETIVSYFSEIGGECENPLYIHCMKMRAGKGGSWDFTGDSLRPLSDNGVVIGIKEEHSSLKDSYDFVSSLDSSLDVIVAGGSMRRHQFLRSAGANSFLSGLGNLFPKIEQQYMGGANVDEALCLETMLFNVFMKNGWHKSLREALRQRELTCLFDRKPWPKVTEEESEEIKNVLSKIEKEIKA